MKAFTLAMMGVVGVAAGPMGSMGTYWTDIAPIVTKVEEVVEGIPAMEGINVTHLLQSINGTELQSILPTLEDHFNLESLLKAFPTSKDLEYLIPDIQFDYETLVPSFEHADIYKLCPGLGPNMPIPDIIKSIKEKNISCNFLSWYHSGKKHTVEELQKLVRGFDIPHFDLGALVERVSNGHLLTILGMDKSFEEALSDVDLVKCFEYLPDIKDFFISLPGLLQSHLNMTEIETILEDPSLKDLKVDMNAFKYMELGEIVTKHSKDLNMFLEHFDKDRTCESLDMVKDLVGVENVDLAKIYVKCGSSEEEETEEADNTEETDKPAEDPKPKDALPTTLEPYLGPSPDPALITDVTQKVIDEPPSEETVNAVLESDPVQDFIKENEDNDSLKDLLKKGQSLIKEQKEEKEESDDSDDSDED